LTEKRDRDATRSTVAEWPPSRIAPESYPGSCPPGHYLLCDGEVLPLAEATARNGDNCYQVVGESGERAPLDAFLADRGAEPLVERFPVLAYGANRNPGTLDIKFHNYGGPALSGAYCIPVLKATIRGADVAACRLHGHGYFYGELLIENPLTAQTEIEVRVLMADLAQLRALNDSEGLPQRMYSAALVRDIEVSGISQSLSPITYVANARVWSSPTSGTPVGYSVIPATGRRYPAMTSQQIMDQVLDTYSLRPAVSRITGLADDATLAHEVSKYLNGQWWYQFNSHDTPIVGYTELLGLVNAAMDASVIDDHSRDRLAAAGLILDTDTAYDPGDTLRLGNALAGYS
jgi:hypothetical protein